MSNESPDLWKFSVALYDREGVADACLELQADFNFDVNLILMCYWYGSCYGEMDERLMRDVTTFSTQWRRHVVESLRNTRSWMKQRSDSSESFDSLRERIKADELAAEKYQQQRIERMVAEFDPVEQTESGGEASRNNIDLLLRTMGQEWNPLIEEKFRLLSAAAAQASAGSG